MGHFLNVHEGPQGIGTRIAYNETHLKAGMTLSNGALSLICMRGSLLVRTAINYDRGCRTWVLR